MVLYIYAEQQNKLVTPTKLRGEEQQKALLFEKSRTPMFVTAVYISTFLWERQAVLLIVVW